MRHKYRWMSHHKIHSKLAKKNQKASNFVIKFKNPSKAHICKKNENRSNEEKYHHDKTFWVFSPTRVKQHNTVSY